MSATTHGRHHSSTWTPPQFPRRHQSYLSYRPILTACAMWMGEINNPRILNFKENTLGWRFKVVHVPGKDQPEAKAMSRNCAETSKVVPLEVLLCGGRCQPRWARPKLATFWLWTCSPPEGNLMSKRHLTKGQELKERCCQLKPLK